MVYASIFCLNNFPPADGVSKTHSPQNIICGQQLDYATHYKLEFGTYMQVHEQDGNSLANGLPEPSPLDQHGTPKGAIISIALLPGAD
jgi:hypothetical protein